MSFRIRPPAALLVLAVAIGACHLPARPPRIAPAESEGEVHVYLSPAEPDEKRLTFELQSVTAIGSDGSAVPLEVIRRDEAGEPGSVERLVAWGRLRPGSYLGLKFAAASAGVAGPDGKFALSVEEPRTVEIAFGVTARKATVLSLSLDATRSVDRGFAFAPAFSIQVASGPLPRAVGLCSNAGMHNLTVFDTHRRRVVGVYPTGNEPRGLAIDERQRRVYVALAGEDRIAVLDLLSGADLGRLPLRPGDDPYDVALLPDGNTLIVANRRSSTAAFLDVGGVGGGDRLSTGLEPVAIVVDTVGRRAYVVNRGSNSISVIDVATRAVVGTVATELEPVRAALSRDGTRLYVVHARSPYLLTVSLRDLTIASRTVVGAPSEAVAVDSRTDLLYVAPANEDRALVFEPTSLIAVSRVDLRGAATDLVFDDVEAILFGLTPRRRVVAAVNPVTGRVLSGFEVGFEPHRLAVSGTRR